MNINNKVRILVVEDEVLLAQDITLRLSKMYDVVGNAASVDTAIELLKSNSVDMMLIDINLQGKKDGIDLAQIVNEQYKIPFIFLTSHADTALVERAKKVKPYAYMLKPFHDREISIAIEMALANFSNKTPEDDLLKKTEFNEMDNQVLNINESLFLKKNNYFHRVTLDEISILEADNNYTTIYTKQEKYIYSTVLKKMEEKLPGNQFFRVHRSYVINIHSVNGFEGNTLFIEDMRIPVSKQYREKIFRLFQAL